MTDTSKLKKAIKASGYKMEYLAKSLGITRVAFSMKLNNSSPFKVEEMYKLADLLSFTEEEKKDIFFNQM